MTNCGRRTAGRLAATPGAPRGSGSVPSSSLRSSDSAAPEPRGPWSGGSAKGGKTVTHVPGQNCHPCYGLHRAAEHSARPSLLTLRLRDARMHGCTDAHGSRRTAAAVQWTTTAADRARWGEAPACISAAGRHRSGAGCHEACVRSVMGERIRREPERTVLHRAVQAGWAAFVRSVAAKERSVPRFCRREIGGRIAVVGPGWSGTGAWTSFARPTRVYEVGPLAGPCLVQRGGRCATARAVL
jgi:hypothetical protein